MAEELFILKNWQEQIIVFNHNLHILRIRPTKKAVHDLRVSIKKLRSYLRLSKEIKGIPISKEFENIDILFKTTGRQRDFEMSASLLSRYRRKENIILIHFRKILQLNCRLTRKWSKQAAQNFNEDCLQRLSEEINSSLSGFTGEEMIQKIETLVNKIYKKAEKLSTHLKKNVHQIRKLLKDPYYWIIALPENVSGDSFNIKLFGKLLDNLGAWQDHFIFLKKIALYKKEFLVKKNEESKVLKICSEAAKKEQALLFNKIKINLKELVSK